MAEDLDPDDGTQLNQALLSAIIKGVGEQLQSTRGKRLLSRCLNLAG